MTASPILADPKPALTDAGLRDIVVHVDDSAPSNARLVFAARFARDLGAHLVAVLAQPQPHLPRGLYGEASEMFLDSWRKQLAATAQQVAAQVAATSGTEGVDIEFRIAAGVPERALLVHARHADMTVLGQAEVGHFSQSAAIESLLFGSGRPVLLVPAVGTYANCGHNVLCAWNGSREAARAVADAMPLLRRAKQVTILAADPPDAAARVPGADIALHLARHGVKVASSAAYAGDLAIGDAILNRAADIGADLLVMGGYGHSRTREAIFGGATRQILDRMTLPVFMSH